MVNYISKLDENTFSVCVWLSHAVVCAHHVPPEVELFFGTCSGKASRSYFNHKSSLPLLS